LDVINLTAHADQCLRITVHSNADVYHQSKFRRVATRAGAKEYELSNIYATTGNPGTAYEKSQLLFINLSYPSARRGQAGVDRPNGMLFPA